MAFVWPGHRLASFRTTEAIMRNPLLLTGAALLVAGSSLAQTEPECPRGRFQLSSGRVTTSVYDFRAWHVATAKNDLPGNIANGIYPTAQVAHAIWVDQNAAGLNTWRYLRSVDGGWSWDLNQVQDIWVNVDQAAGATFDGGEVEFDVLDNVISVVFTANRDTNGQFTAGGDDYVWAVVSADQGQTWQSICVSQGMDNVLTTGDDLSECDEPVAKLAKVGSRYYLHVAFEADYDFAVGANAASGQEDVWYNRVDIAANGALSLAFPEERRMDDAHPSGTIDEDLPHLWADGLNVGVVWIDDRVSVNGGMGANNAFQNTYLRYSLDGGATFAAEVDCTQLTTAGGFGYRQPLVKIYGNMVFVVSEDSRNMSDDDLWLTYTNDISAATPTWVRNIRADTVPATIDSDGKDFFYNTDIGEFFISWIDDREGTGNADNDVRGAYGTLAEFQNGTQTEVEVYNSTCNHSHYNLDRLPGTSIYVQSLETGCGEDAAVAWSTDNGRTWELCETVGGGNADADDPSAAITLNRDIVSVVQQDDGQGNNNNVVEVNGLKLPLLTDETRANRGLTFRGGIASDDMDAAILFAALTPPTSLGFALPNGPSLNFTPDALTLGSVGNLGLFLALIDANGEARWPFPNFATLIGQDIYYVVGTVDLLSNTPTAAFSDPVRQRP